MEFDVLGPLRVRAGDTTIDIRRGLPRTLLAFLTLHPGDTVRSEVLADVLWGDQQPVNPANALQTQISYVRRQLSAHTPRQPIVTRPGGYALDVDPECIDAHRFSQVVHRAATALVRDDHDPVSTVAVLDEALSWWRGDALDDVAGEPFAVGEAARLNELRLTAVELRHTAALALGRHREIVGDLTTLAHEHPLRERLHELLMIALYRSGRQAEALRAFASARDHLVDELGIEPGPELRALERRILDHDASLLLDAPDRPHRSHGSPPETTTPTSSIESTATTSQHLPAPITTLIGRDIELQRVAGLLERSRCVTLTGPPGAGKSRLAIEVARTFETTNEVWYIDLGELDDPTQVGTAIAAAIDVPAANEQGLAQTVIASLATRRGLLLLDTCEHVLAAVAGIVGRLLREAPGIRVLATSRRPLQVNGEIAWPVPPLALAAPGTPIDQLGSYPSVQLFVARAQGVHHDFELTSQVADDVIGICMALDGLPLAIELAAARVDVLPPRLIRERLIRRFDLLVGGGNDASTRQQTLRSAIAWSIDLLDERERVAFARLGVFTGSFDFDSAACVTTLDADDHLAVMTTLVRHSMIVRVEGDRFRLLDTLRAYALEMLDELDADATRARHARCFVAAAEAAEIGVRGPDQVDWLARARADLSNHRSALDWMTAAGDGVGAARLAGALAWTWTLDGLLAEARQQLEGVLAFTDLPDGVRAKACWGMALVVASLGDLRRADVLAREALERARAADDPVQTAYALHTIAVVQWGLGDHDAADASRDGAIELFDRHHEQWGAALSRVLRGRSALDRQPDRACDHVDGGLRAATLTGDRHLLGMAHEQQARLALRHGDATIALQHAESSLALHETIGYTEGALAALHVRAQTKLGLGDLDGALADHHRALRDARTIGHRAAMCEAIDGIATVHDVRGQRDEATTLVALVTAERHRLGVPRRPDDTERLSHLIPVAAPGAPERQAAASAGFDEMVLSLLAPE